MQFLWVMRCHAFIYLWGLLGPFRIIVLYIDASVGFAVPCQCYRVVLIP